MKLLKRILSIFLLVALMFYFFPETTNVNASISRANVTANERINFFKGTKAASGWTQVITVDTVNTNQGTFDPSKIRQGGYFEAEYTGSQNSIEMVFQSWTGGASWAIVKPSEVTSQEDGLTIAKFTYDDIVASYGTDLQLLNRLYLNTTTNNIILHSFDFCFENNTEAPEIKFINIGDNATITMPPYSDYLPVGAIANDKNGKLLSVVLYLDNRKFTEIISETGKSSLTTSFAGWFYSPGTYTFYAEATTTDGLTFRTDIITVTVYPPVPTAPPVIR